MKSTNLMTAVLLTTVFFLGACSKDQDLDDYKNTRLQINMAKISSVQGQYTGYLVSKKDGATLGALQVTLQTTTQVQNSTDQSKASAQPLLVANVEFQGQSHMAIVAQNSYYDSTSGHFDADIPIQLQQQNSQGQTVAVTVTVTLSAVISGGQITGSMSAVGYNDFGGTFTLTNGGGNLATLVKRSSPANNVVFSQGNYFGKSEFLGTDDGSGKNLISKQVNLIILKPQTTSEQDFLNLLVPVKPVQVTLNYGNGARILFSNGTWDLRTGVLAGQSTFTRGSIGEPTNANSQTATLSLTCHSTPDNQVFDCLLSTSTSSGPVAKIHVDSQSTVQPPDSSVTRDPVIRVYQGKAEVVSGQWEDLTLTVLYPARNRMDEILDLIFPQSEKILQVAFNLPKWQIGASFSNAKWDIGNSTLDASQVLTVNNQPVSYSLSCQNFHFEQAPYEFSCSYISTLRNMYVPFKFSAQK